MLSHRLRALLALVPVLALSGLLVASPSLAAQTLRITSPLAGTTVAGIVEVSGTADGNAGSPLSVALAPQRFGDCAAPLVEQTAVVGVSGDFAASISSTSVADGTYCVIVTVGDGRLSTAVGGVTVLNDSGLDDTLDDVQLPTRALFDDAASSDEALRVIADVQFLAPVVVGAAATLALVVLVMGLLQRRRTE